MSRQIGIVLIVILVLLVFFGVQAYNRLIKLDADVNNKWAQIETVLQRRYDLIPNLVNTVKGYATHERELFEEITRQRSQWSAAKTTDAKAAAATQLESTLARLMVVVENYPNLKANQNFLALQDELAGTENRIVVERRRFNEAVREYNVAIRLFPTNLFAGLLGFHGNKNYFEAAGEAKTAPKVQF
jgi:LemA protein